MHLGHLTCLVRLVGQAGSGRTHAPGGPPRDHPGTVPSYHDFQLHQLGIFRDARGPEATMRYYSVNEEIKAAAPGRLLVHNHAPPAERSGTRGFRAWEDK
jgi:hypothetical protein